MKASITILIFLLLMMTPTLAFIEEEKPCGHAYREGALRDMAPTAEQEKLDMTYYSIDMELDVSNNSFEAQYLAAFTVLDTSVTAFQLDFSNSNSGVGQVQVHSVLVDNDTAEYVHSGNMLFVLPPDTMTPGQGFLMEINASAGPANNGDNAGFNWDYENGTRAIWTNSQPYNARHWWPSIDYPRDKADSMDIAITVDDAFIVASNGRLLTSSHNMDATRTWRWHVGHPIATYLVSLSIYPFYEWGDIYVDANGDTLPIEFYTYSHPDNPEPSYMTENYLLVPDMIELFAEQFGPYPFMDEKYGHAEWGENYGMEHQTLTSMGDPTERRVAHELAHMWYGDMITCHSYHHIWLNEGFARYAEALWWEEHYGIAGYHEKMDSFEYYGPGTIYVEDTENESIFGLNLSYNKPAWVLHMLRHMVGDDLFFQIMQSYAADTRFAYGTASTEDFQGVCEDLTGLDLENFFQQWIYGQGAPIYRIYRGQTGQDLLIQTIQSGNVFDMPVDFRITTNQGVIDTVLRINEQFMTFNFTLEPDQIVTNLVVDPGDWILNTASYVVGLAEHGPQQPLTFGLDENYPNPFNPTTTIPYTLEEDGVAEMTIVDALGREVRTLRSGHYMAGQYETTWDGRDQDENLVETGIYFCRLTSAGQTDIQKLLLIK